MSMNMSYCRFENTRRALEECLNALEDQDVASEGEVSEGKRMFDQFLMFCFEEGIIDGYDEKQMEKVMETGYEEDEE